jgi:hypothetical protein
MKAGVDLRGICIYPVLDRPDWDTFDYIHCGIWAYDENGERTTVTDYAADVQECVVQMEHYLKTVAEPAKRGKQALAV